MTVILIDIHMTTYEYDLTACATIAGDMSHPAILTARALESHQAPGSARASALTRRRLSSPLRQMAIAKQANQNP